MKFPALSIAPEMAKDAVKDGWIVGQQRDFRGGETQARLPEAVGINQLLRMENAMLFPTGELTAAHQADTNLITGAELGITLVQGSDGTYTAYSAPGNGVIYGQFLDTSANSPVDMNNGSQRSVTGARITGASHAVRFLGKDYCVNPNEDDTKDGILNLTDFSLINVLSGGVGAKLRLYMNRLWLLSSTGELHNSNNGDAATWNPLNIMLLANSEPIVDFHPVPGGAIVYSSTMIYAMYGASYTDITFLPLLQSGAGTQKHFTPGSVEVGGIVYILSSEGIYEVSLNGAKLIPHHQEQFFKECHNIFADPAKVITAIYLQPFKAVIFTWLDSYKIDGQSLVFYLSNGAYSKLNRLLPAGFPYALALNDSNTDYIWASSSGTFAKSEYPSANMVVPQPSILQTRHEDADSTREKVWGSVTVKAGETVYGVTIDAYLDESTTPISVMSGGSFPKGENLIWLDHLPRSRTISFLFTIDNSTILSLVSDDDHTIELTDDLGNVLVTGINPGNWTIKALKLRYREAGPDL